MKRVIAVSVIFMISFASVIHIMDTDTVCIASITPLTNTREPSAFHDRYLGMDSAGVQSLVDWNETYAGGWIHSVQQTLDGGYVMAGEKSGDMWLLKTDYEGNHEWNRTYDGDGHGDRAYSVALTYDGGYVMAGYMGLEHWNGRDHTDIWVVRTDSLGNLRGQWSYGSLYDERAYCIRQTSDGGYIVAGEWEHRNIWGNQDFDFYILRFNSLFSRVFDGTYNSGTWDSAFSVVETSEGSFVAVGRGGAAMTWLISVDSQGILQWSKLFGLPGSQIAKDIRNTFDGGFILTGVSESDLWLVKLDQSGDQVWERDFGGDSSDSGEAVCQTEDGGYLAIGWTYSITNDYDFWLVRTDIDGHLEWNMSIGGLSRDFGWSLCRTSDGGAIVAGYTESLETGVREGWAVKLSRTYTDFSIYPSPYLETVHQGSFAIFDITSVYSGEFESPISLGISGLPSGMTAQFDSPLLAPTHDQPLVTRLTIMTTISTATGSYFLRLKGSSGIIERSCQIVVTVEAAKDYVGIAHDEKLEGESAYFWQSISYRGAVYYVFLYSLDAIEEFSVRDQYVDKSINGQLRVRAITEQGEKWVDIEGVIVVDEEGNIIKNDDTSRVILTLAESQGYYWYAMANNLERQDFDDFYESVENTVSEIFNNPAFWPTLVLYHMPPPTSMQLYKELLLGIFESATVDKTIGTRASKDSINKYIDKVTAIIDMTAENQELEDYELFLSQSADLQELVESSNYLTALHTNLQTLLDALEEYKPVVTVAKNFVKFLVGVALEKTIAQEYLPYLRALRTYVQVNAKSSYDREWMGLLEALNDVIGQTEESHNFLDELAFGGLDLLLEVGWDITKDVFVDSLETWLGEYAISHGLSISQVGHLFNSINIAVGVGIILGDLLFDLTEMYHNMDLMMKTKQLNSIIKETYDKISSGDITRLEANIEARRLQFSLLIRTYELLAQNADGAGLTGTARAIMNYLRELIGELLGHDVQTTEEYINTIRSVWIPYYSFLRSLSVPPLHDIESVEPRWRPYFFSTSSTAVVNTLMIVRRGLDDPCLISFMTIDQYWFPLDGYGNINITVHNPSDVEISHIWVNSTHSPKVNMTPHEVYLDYLVADQSWTTSFSFSFNQPGMHALSFWICAENGTYVYFESTIVEVYLEGMNVTMNPSFPTIEDLVTITVTNSSGYALSNAIVLLQSPEKLITTLTNYSGNVIFEANVTGLWSISVSYPNEPAYGPVQFAVSLSEEDTFILEVDDLSASEVLSNSNYHKGFRVINNGATNLQLVVELLGEADWLTSQIIPVHSDEYTFENATSVSTNIIEVDLPSGHWTSGNVLLLIEANTTLGSQVALTLNASAIGGQAFNQNTFNVTVNTDGLFISISNMEDLSHGDNLTAQVRIKDQYNNATTPDSIVARLNNLNITSNIIPVKPGLFNLTIPYVESGIYILEIAVRKDGFKNKSVSLPVIVHEREFDIQLTETQLGSALNLTIELVDTVTPRNMTGANVFGVLEDQGENKTIVIFIETQPGNYETSLDFTGFPPGSHFNLTIHASKKGYTSETFLMKLISPLHDVMASTVICSRNVVSEDYATVIHINVTVANLGTFTESFNVTVYYNGSAIDTQNVTLISADSITVNFTWNTTSHTKGNYSIIGYAWSVPSETYLDNNNSTSAWVVITISGDIDGNRNVDIFDIVRMTSIYGVSQPDPRYNPNCDIDGDDDIDIFDIVTACIHYGESW